MKTVAKYITAKTLQPAVKKYLSKTRNYRYGNIKIVIPSGVFHPAFFFSTKILLNYILQSELNNKKFLELGAGSGLISFAAAQKNARVTATDINPVAIEYLKINSEKNNLSVQIILSDVFDNISEQQFDIIAINPPYYKKEPETYADFAWYCGANGEYFSKLFAQLQKYIYPESLVLMILSEGCDIAMIRSIAEKYSFSFGLLETRKNMLESNFIFSITRQANYFNEYNLVDNVYVKNSLEIKSEFEEKYIAIRKKENRIYTDAELQSLPNVPKSHPHFKEWIVREKSANRLLNYLAKKNKPLKILEVGCGNGWLSNFLSTIKKSYIVGLDINFEELQQAARVFKNENLFFIYDMLSDELLKKFNFDMVVFAASAQYFLSIQQTIKMVLSGLNTEGEIHIIDTHFYRTDEIGAAKKRTEKYYASLGFPEFSVHYHHHSIDELNAFCVDKLYDPTSAKNLLEINKNPFLWLRVIKPIDSEDEKS